MNCCNDYGRCTRGPNCPARHSADHSAQPTQALQQLDDELSPQREALQLLALLGAYLVISLAAIAVVMGYGWGRIGRDWVATLFAGVLS